MKRVKSVSLPQTPNKHLMSPCGNKWFLQHMVFQTNTKYDFKVVYMKQALAANIYSNTDTLACPSQMSIPESPSKTHHCYMTVCRQYAYPCECDDRQIFGVQHSINIQETKSLFYILRSYCKLEKNLCERHALVEPNFPYKVQ